MAQGSFWPFVTIFTGLTVLPLWFMVRSEIKFSVYIDNNVWDFFFDKEIDLAKELPPDKFHFCIPPHAKFEIDLIPDLGKREFIRKTMNERVETKSYFGFANPMRSDEEQLNGGFGDLLNPDVGGDFAEIDESELRENLERRYLKNKKRPTGLYENEMDIELATRSLHDVVLTLDKKRPLTKGYRVVFLNDFDQSNLTLAAFIISKTN